VASVAYLANPIDTLISIDAENWIIVVATHYGKPNVGNLEITGAGVCANCILKMTEADLVVGRELRHHWLLFAISL
jgi:hypothetical protein